MTNVENPISSPLYDRLTKDFRRVAIQVKKDLRTSYPEPNREIHALNKDIYSILNAFYQEMSEEGQINSIVVNLDHLKHRDAILNHLLPRQQFYTVPRNYIPSLKGLPTGPGKYWYSEFSLPILSQDALLCVRRSGLMGRMIQTDLVGRHIFPEFLLQLK